MVGLAGWGEAGQAKQGKRGGGVGGGGGWQLGDRRAGVVVCGQPCQGSEEQQAGNSYSAPSVYTLQLCWREGGLGEKVEPRICAC